MQTATKRNCKHSFIYVPKTYEITHHNKMKMRVSLCVINDKILSAYHSFTFTTNRLCQLKWTQSNIMSALWQSWHANSSITILSQFTENQVQRRSTSVLTNTILNTHKSKFLFFSVFINCIKREIWNVMWKGAQKGGWSKIKIQPSTQLQIYSIVSFLSSRCSKRIAYCAVNCKASYAYWRRSFRAICLINLAKVKTHK